MSDARTSEFRQHWRVLLGCAMAASIGTIGLHGYTSGAFLPALMSDGGFTREEVSLATLILSATVAVVVPFCGALMDRYGPLRVISFAVIGEACAFTLLGLVPSSFPAYAAAIVALALLGVGTTPPGFARIIAARFDRARGLALGTMISGLGLMAITGPIWATWLIQALGWRGAYMAIGALVLLFGGAGLLLIRSDHGAPAPTQTAVDPASGETGGWSALGHPLYWLMLLGFVLPAFFCHGYILHLISLLREQGFSPAEAARVQSLVGVAVLLGRLGSGWALDRFPARRVAATAFTISGLGCTMLLVDSGFAVSIAALSIGLTVGAELDIMAYFISRYFGVVSFSRLYSLAYSGLIVGGGASPLLVATIVGWSGGYTAAVMVSVAGTLAGAVLLSLLPPPRHDGAEPSIH